MRSRALSAGVMQLLRPLLMDSVPTIQQTAAVALGRLANHNDDLAEAVVKGDILPQLVYSLAEQNVRVIPLCVVHPSLIPLPSSLGLLLTLAEVLQKGRCLCAQSCGQAFTPTCAGDQALIQCTPCHPLRPYTGRLVTCNSNAFSKLSVN